MIFCQESNIGGPLSPLRLLKTGHHVSCGQHHHHTVMTLDIIMDKQPLYISPQIAKGKFSTPFVHRATRIPYVKVTRKKAQIVQYCSRADMLSKAYLSFQGSLRPVVVRSNLLPTG